MAARVYKPFDYPAPASAEAWEAGKAGLRAKLRELLGEWPPLFTPEPKRLFIEDRDGYFLEKISFDNGLGDTVNGYVCVPKGRTAPGPAILYNHWHGGEYHIGKDELFKNWPTAKQPADVLTREGYVVLAIDAYAFGERQHQGPAGDRDGGGATEAALFKTFIWQGYTMWGLMVRDDTLALNYLLSRPDVDPARVGATGCSMGSTRTWWLAALDDRVRAAVCVACLTRYQDLIDEGKVNAHGIYYYVPDLLREGIDMEAVIGLIAPRPLLTLTGDQDGGSPVSGVHKINAFCKQLYGLYGASDDFRGEVYEGLGHVYTEEMWKKMLAWMAKHLNA